MYTLHAHIHLQVVVTSCTNRMSSEPVSPFAPRMRPGEHADEHHLLLQ